MKKIILLLTMIDSPSEREYAAWLYEQYGKLMRYCIFQIVHDWNTADDLLQDAMCRLFPHLEKLQGYPEAHVRGYVCRAARTAALNEVDPQRRKRYFSGEVEALSDLDSESPEEIIVRQEEIAQIRGILNELPPRDRDLLFYKYFEGVGNREIAKLCGLNEHSVNQRLSDARHRALKLLNKGEPD